MIGKLSGIYGGTGGEGIALIEVGGVGYAVRTVLAFFATTRHGDSVSLFIFTAVKDDSIDLYGFKTEEELRFYKQLMSVSGIGPKSALTILNVADVATLREAIAEGDATILTKVFGIGKKSAERIVVELRDKMALENPPHTEAHATGGDAEVVEALMALGYSAQEAREALKEIGKKVVGVRERVSATLKYLGSSKKVA